MQNIVVVNRNLDVFDRKSHFKGWVTGKHVTKITSGNREVQVLMIGKAIIGIKVITNLAYNSGPIDRINR